MEELKLPELGEDVDSVEVAAVLVAKGDRVDKDQPVIEVETEKASLEVPAEAAGVVREVLVGKGDKLKVGQVILRLDTGAPGDAGEPDRPASADTEPRHEEEGAAPRSAASTDQGDEEAAAAGEAGDAEPRSQAAAGVEVDRAPAVAPPGRAIREEPVIGLTVPAAPSTRRLAREIGVEIDEVRGTGPGGRISREDVKAHAKRLIRAGGKGAPAAAPELPDFSQWGEIDSQPLSALRRATAANMARAWNTVPHVTQFDRADISQIDTMRRRFNERPEAAERKLTMTAIVIKLVAGALRQFPKFNSSLDLARDVVVHKKYVHIGVAVDTRRGLLVPVIRDVDRKSLLQVAAEVGELAERARDKKLSPDEMRGATFTVSNLGGLGTTYFSPIVNWPEVAILGVGRAEQRAVPADGKIEARLILPLSLSYDHRLIDGADAARFLRWVAEALEQPLLLLLDE